MVFWLMTAVVVFAFAFVSWEVTRHLRPSGMSLLRFATTWPSHGFDRVMTGTADGKLMECFDPPWHHLRRWYWWASSATRLARGRIVMVRGDQKFAVRVFAPDPMVARRVRGRLVSFRDEELDELRRRASDGRPN